MQLTHNSAGRLPTWDELTSSTRRPSANETDFLAAVQRLRDKPPSWGYHLGRFVVNNFLRDKVYQKFLDYRWGDIIDVMADQVLRNRELIREESQLPESVPLSDRAGAKFFRPYNQMPCTRGTAVRRVSKALELVDLDQPILLLGDDDLVSVELALAGFRQVTAVDIDDKVLAEIERVAHESDVKVRLIQHDLSKPVPLNLYNDYRMVFFDPDYSVKGVELFLGSALEITRQRPGTLFFLSVHLMSLRPSGLPELVSLLDAFDVEIREFQQGFNAYPVPGRLKSLIHLANQIVIGSKTLTTEGYGFPFFLSDAILLRKI